jgi:hypothetical protein
MAKVYYLIRDAKEINHVVAIHMVYDSAMACFQRIVNGGNFERFLDMYRVTVDEWGDVRHEYLMYSFARHNRTLVNHMTIHSVDISGGTPRLTIHIP